MKDWQKWLAGLVIGYLSGIGTMQATLVSDSHEHSLKIKYLEEYRAEDKVMFEKRLDNVVRLWEATLESQRELIAALREKEKK